MLLRAQGKAPCTRQGHNTFTIEWDPAGMNRPMGTPDIPLEASVLINSAEQEGSQAINNPPLVCGSESTNIRSIVLAPSMRDAWPFQLRSAPSG